MSRCREKGSSLSISLVAFFPLLMPLSPLTPCCWRNHRVAHPRSLYKAVRFHPSCDAFWGFLPPQRITLVWWSCLVREIQIHPQHTHTHTHTHTHPSPHTPSLSQQACSSSPAPEFPWGSGQRLCSDTCLPVYLPHENGEGPQRNSKGTDTNRASWPSPVNINWSEASQELQAGLYWSSCTHRRE